MGSRFAFDAQVAGLLSSSHLVDEADPSLIIAHKPNSQPFVFFYTIVEIFALQPSAQCLAKNICNLDCNRIRQLGVVNNKAVNGRYCVTLCSPEE